MTEQPLTVEQANEIVGDDILYWLTNRFMTPEMLAEKVCWWIGAALSTPPGSSSGGDDRG